MVVIFLHILDHIELTIWKRAIVKCQKKNFFKEVEKHLRPILVQEL